MRAITVRQPWAWAIVHGGKDVENRSRNIAGAYRGPVAIHAAMQPDNWWPETAPRDILRAVLAGAVAAGVDKRDFWYLRGSLIGVADLVAVHYADTCFDNPSGPCSRWAVRMHQHLVLANPRPLPEPVRATGHLGLWTLPADIEDEVLRQVTL